MSTVRPDASCPLRPGEPCTWCHPEATGPQNCPTVALMLADDELRSELARRRREHAARDALRPDRRSA